MSSWARNVLPAVSLTSPAGGAIFAAPASITLTATASDKDGTVSRVDFYQGATFIGSDSTAPYSIAWNNVTGGTYSLSAVATDNLGASKTSTAVIITVTGPKILIGAPAGGTTLYGGGSVLVTGTFTGDASSTVLVDNGTSSRLATIANNTYSANIPLFLGANTLTVSVARTDKTSDTASVTVTGADYPKIAFRSPTGATFDAPADLLFDVDAISPGGAIGKVDFYKNGVLAGTATSPPYRYTLPNALAQSYTIQAKATDSLGYSSYASTTVTGLGPNTPPNVAFTSPINGATYTAPANINMTVNANDPDGSVVMVNYYQNGALLGSTNVAPYSFNWSNVPAGAYTLTASATDNRSGTATSAPVTIAVTPPNATPTVSLTSPVSGATFYAPATIALGASAADSDGTIARVDFYQGAILLGTATGAPYTYNWTDIPAGSYTITAKATDNLGGATMSAPVPVTVMPNAAPTVSLTSPASGLDVYAPANIALGANAADSDGAIVRVDFYRGSTLIGTATGAPYTYTWADAPAGTYTITAVATDNLGATATSPAVTVTVTALQVGFTSPANGAALTGNIIQVSGTFQGPANSGVTVNGAVAALDANNRFYAMVPLSAGSNTITATITTQAGNTATQHVTVTSDGTPPPLDIGVDTAEGIAPFTSNFSFTGTGATPGNISVSGGAVTVTANGNLLSVTYPNPGTYTVTITATDSLGNAVNKTFMIVAKNVVQIDQLLRQVYSDMLSKLGAGDVDGALLSMTGSAHDRYLSEFTELKPYLADIVPQLGNLQDGEFNNKFAKFRLLRATPNGMNAFDVYLIRGTDGIWRIDGM